MIKIISEIKRLGVLFPRQEKGQYLFLLGLMLFGALLDILGISIIPAFIAVIIVPEELMRFPIAIDFLELIGMTPGQELIYWSMGLLLTIFVLKNLYLTWMYHFQFRLVEYQRVRLANRLFSAYLFAPYSFIINRNSAELMRNVQVETMEIIRGIVIPLLSAIMGTIMTVFTLILMIIATPWIALVGLFFIGGGSALFFQAVRGKLERYGEVAKIERKETLKAINQGLGAIVDAKILGREQVFISAFQQSLANFARVDRLRQTIGKAAPHLLEIISVAGLIAIIIGLMVSKTTMTNLIPILALFGVATMRLRQTISQIIAGITQIRYSLPSIDNVISDLEVLESQQIINISQLGGTDDVFRSQIELKNVFFHYSNSEEPVLTDINLRIKKGESIAFVGATGSGKSTLIKLILGLFHPSEGDIKVDNKSIYSNLPSWYSKIGYIPQNIFLTDDTIESNIAFGIPKEQINKASLQKAIQAAQLEQFISLLPEGAQTFVGERGVRLSGGQLQRIGLARALYHSPSILIMDEATSALDNQTENLVIEALKQLKFERTIIMIAHRLSTVQECDRLFFLNNGRIDGVGTYNQLLENHSNFRKMAELQ